MLTSEMDEPRWRAFRLFLAALSDEELPVVRDQLDREVTARRECETNAVRLFYSSLAAPDLEAARREIDVVCGKSWNRSTGSGSPGVRLSTNRRGAGHFTLAFRANRSDESSCADQPPTRTTTTMKNKEAKTTETAPVAEQQVAPERAVSKKAASQKKGTPKAQKTAKSKKAKKEGKTKKNVAKPKPSPPRAESKGAQILEMIGRAKGATLAELMQTTGWQAHSVRGFISIARKEHRLKIESSKNEVGDRMYTIGK